MSVNGHHSVSAAHFQSAVDCPREVLELTVGATGSGGAPAQPVARAVNRTDSQERALLIRAFTSANDGLAAAQGGLGTVGAAVARSHHAAETAIETVERFTAAESPAAGRKEIERVAGRHAGDGPEDLRWRPLIWRILFWPVLLASAAFDSVYVAKILHSFLQFGPHDSWLLTHLIYVPGVGVSVCLLAAGTFLSESVFRLRTRAARMPVRQRRGRLATLRNALWSRQPKGDQEIEERPVDGLPWPNLFGPALFTVAILGMICWWAYIRASQAADSAGVGDLFSYKPGIVLLLLILSVAVVVTKVLAYNPCADSDARSRKALKAEGKSAGRLLTEAREALARHVDAWLRLRATTETVRGAAHRTLDTACAVIVEERARSGIAGSFDFPLEAYLWPHAKGADERAGDGRTDDSSAEAETRQPRVRFELLDDAQSILKGYDPEALSKRLVAVAQALNSQWRLAERAAEPVSVESKAVEPSPIEEQAGTPETERGDEDRPFE